MKKIIALLACITMLALIPTTALAADVLFQDNFNSGEINESDWYPGAFFVDNGGPTNSPHVEDYGGWHVLQSMYNNENGGNRVFGANVAFKVDAWAWEDGGEDRSEHRLGLWFADYFSEPADGRIVYQFQVCYETRKAVLIATGEGDGTTYFDPGVYSSGVIVGSWDIPESVPFEMDVTDPTVISLGMRVNGTLIDCYLNDMKVISYTAPRMGAEKSPVLLVNDGCYAGFDNFIVATADYNLFNESSTPVNNEPANNDPVNNDPEETETRIDTVIVTDTDDEGNVVTRVETEKTVVPAPNTGNGGGGNRPATKTGDTIVVVIAVMVAALGSAIVVKKVCVKK